MAVDLLHSSDHSDDEVEDYIDIEVSTKPNLFLHSKTSPPHPREFEFQMFSISSERDTTSSPADELFYKGKLLPLHLPPRLQMVEKLLQNSTYPPKKDCFEEYFSTPLATTAYTTPTANTPFESCNVSPNESCQVSRELNPDEYFFNYSTGEANINFISDNPKKSWTRKMKQSTLGSKLKASRAYLKSLFGKPDRSDEPSAALAERSSSPFKVSASCTKEDINTHTKMSKKAPFGQIQRYEKPKTKSFNKEKVVGDNGAHHRRSFSGAIKRLSTAKSFSSASSSSSTSSTSSNRIHDSHLLKRSSSSVCSDAENSIQSAIAHCKQSQQEFHSRRTISEIGLCSMSVLSASTVIMEDHETSGICIS